MTKLLLNQLNFKFLKLILVILFVQINTAVGKEKLNLTYDNIEVFLEGKFVQGGLVIGKSDPKIEIKFKNNCLEKTLMVILLLVLEEITQILRTCI